MLDYQVGLCIQGDGCLAPPLAAEIDRRGVLAKAENLLRAARTSGAYIVHVRLGFDDTYELRSNRTARFDRYRELGLMKFDSPAAQFVPQLEPVDEPVIIKGCVDSFIGTPLLNMLLGNSISTVILAGVATNLVVESTARHAADLGVSVVVVEDACAGFTPQLHAFAVNEILPMFANVITHEETIDSYFKH
jgi:nicotinamidase-related amidase